MIRHFLNINLKKCHSIIIILFLSGFIHTRAQTVIPILPDAYSYVGNTQGFWFTSPTSIIITGLRVPDDGIIGDQSLQLIKLNAPPPVYTSYTSTFTTLHYSQNISGFNFIPVNIPVNAGERIGILGCRSSGTGQSISSLSEDSIYVSNIAGIPVTLTRAGCQSNIINGAATSFWQAPSSHQIGRVEIMYIVPRGKNNAGITGLVSPGLFCGGPQTIKIRLADKGANRLDSVRINWKLDGISQSTIYWTSPLDTLGSSAHANDTVITLGNAPFTFGVGRTLKAWTSMPNGVADTMNADDTLNIVLKTGLSGNYTVGGNSPDYPNILYAVAELNSFGVCGPVDFTIRSGAYNGRLSIGNVGGTSAGNPVVFRSSANHPDSVMINYASPNVTTGVLNLNGSSCLKFKSLTFNQTYYGASSCIYINGSASNDTFENCNINSITTPTAISYAVYDPSSGYTNGLVLKNNRISGGYHNIYLEGTSNCVIDGNILQGSFSGSYSLYNNNRIKFKNNTLNPLITNAIQDFDFWYADSSADFTGNKINLQNPACNMYFYYWRNGNNDRSLIANNVFTGSVAATTINIYMGYSSTHLGIYHNSFNLNYISGVGPTIFNDGANGIDVKNNVFANNASGCAASFYYPPSVYAVTSDYNNFYTNGPVLIRVVNPPANSANLPLWRAANPGVENNSMNYRPGFTSGINLMPNAFDSASWCLNGRGDHIVAVTDDINGISRPVNKTSGVPDIGAYEFTPQVLPPVATMVSGPAISGYTGQVYSFGSEIIARISWNNTYEIPPFVHIRRRTGIPPAHIIPASTPNYMFFYDSIYVPPGNYSYLLDLEYKDPWLGKINNEANLAVIKNTNPPLTQWALTSSTPTVDVTFNKISTPVLTSFGLFTGTDVSNPLPVHLLNLYAASTAKNIHVSWITASEINSSYFNLERSTDGKQFEVITQLKASGNSKTYREYAYDDIAGKSLLSKGMVYYRLAIIDIDGASDYSKIVAVKENHITELIVEVFPNPFSDQLLLKADNFEDTEMQIEILDLNGKQVYTNSFTGSSHIVNNLESLPAGIYFAKLSSNAETKVVKLVKR
ncbi:MAG: T9SS type A sorting domain-containing protein [Bacteroidota bacterium]|nr:T9SS type A sorting domain-containing protein [Bacteroidota bacterium]